MAVNKLSMTDISDKFNINLNQNLWALIVSFLALAISEYYCLKTLFILSTVMAGFATGSMIFCLVAYTKHYWNKKLN